MRDVSDVFGKWSPLRLVCLRRGHSATRLADGRVLLAGGGGRGASKSDGVCNFSDPRSHVSAEIVDPAQGASRTTDSLSQPREGHSGLLLADGSVLVVGGVGDYG